MMNHADPASIRAIAADHRICVVIPTFNNASTLGGVIEGVLRYVGDVYVVNDGSTDDTGEVLSSFAGKIRVISYSRNRGKGYALKKGFREARNAGFEYAVTLDSDGQHRPSDLPAFVETIVRNPGRLIVGSRDLTKVEINGKSSFANKFSNFWFALQTGLRLSDTQTGYRAYPLRSVRRWFPISDRYEAELALMVFMRWNGVRFVELPINVYYPPASERVSHFRPGVDFARISVLNTFLCVGAAVYGLPSAIIRYFARRNPFNFEFRPFTRRKGAPKEAALTLGRLGRSLFSIVAFAIFTIFIFTPYTALYFLAGRTTPRKKLRYHRQIHALAGFASRNIPGSSLTVLNPAGESFQRPAVIICNHQSHIDLSSILSVTPRLIFLTNDWVWRNPFYGYAIRKADFCPVSYGIEKVMPRLRQLVEEGYSIAVFPEGTRSTDGAVHRFHQGAFHIAKELGIDVIPMTLHGAWQLLPKTDFMLRRGPVTLEIGERIASSSMSGVSAKEMASQCRRMIASNLKTLSERLEDCRFCETAVYYRYAYRGWSIVAAMRRELHRVRKYHHLFDNIDPSVSVCVLNAGIGVIPLLVALANPAIAVTAVIEDRDDFAVATGTALLPANLTLLSAPFHVATDSHTRTYLLVRTSRDRAMYGSLHPTLLPLV